MDESVVDAMPAAGPVPVRASGNLSRLTPRQAETLVLRAQGLPVRDVAARLGISEQTVKNHITAAYRELDVDNIVSAFVTLGWLRLPKETA